MEQAVVDLLQKEQQKKKATTTSGGSQHGSPSQPRRATLPVFKFFPALERDAIRTMNWDVMKPTWKKAGSGATPASSVPSSPVTSRLAPTTTTTTTVATVPASSGSPVPQLSLGSLANALQRPSLSPLSSPRSSPRRSSIDVLQQATYSEVNEMPSANELKQFTIAKQQTYRTMRLKKKAMTVEDLRPLIASWQSWAGVKNIIEVQEVEEDEGAKAQEEQPTSKWALLRKKKLQILAQASDDEVKRKAEATQRSERQRLTKDILLQERDDQLQWQQLQKQQQQRNEAEETATAEDTETQKLKEKLEASPEGTIQSETELKKEEDRKEQEQKPDEGPMILRDDPDDLEGYLAVFQDKEGSRAVENINLSALGLGDESVASFMEAVRGSHPAVLRCLKGMVLDANDLHEVGARAISDVLKTNGCEMISLSLKWNSIGIDGAPFLADALMMSDTLTVLQLEMNELEAEGMIALAEGLKTNTSLTDVNLMQNEIGDEGARALAEALKENNSIKCLDISGNNIGRGAMDLAEALRHNQTIRYLVLSENMLYDEGATAIAAAMKEDNRTLVSLEVKDNSIGETGLLALAEALQVNPTFNDLDATLNMLSLKAELAFMGVIERDEEEQKQSQQEQKERRDVIWKDPDMPSMWSEEEIKAIVDHYGSANILNRLLDGRSFRPLIGDEDLLHHLSLSYESAIAFLDRVLSEEGSLMAAGIDMLIVMLKRWETSNHDPNTAWENMEPFLQALHNRMDQFLQILISNKGTAIQTTAGPVHPVGTFRLKIVELLRSIIQANFVMFDLKLRDSGSISAALDLFIDYKWNNFLHHQVRRFIAAALHANRELLTREVISGCNLLMGIASKCSDECEKEQGQRNGYTGDLIELAKEVIKAASDNELLRSLTTENEVWKSFTENQLAQWQESQEWPFPRPVWRPPTEEEIQRFKERENAKMNS
ncbi:C-src tyrosine kinase [Balamuthia mandrillaris]